MSETLGMTMSILGYNTWLFGNALQDVSAEQAATSHPEQIEHGTHGDDAVLRDTLKEFRATS